MENREAAEGHDDFLVNVTPGMFGALRPRQFRRALFFFGLPLGSAGHRA